MCALTWLSDAQLRRIAAHSSLLHWVLRVDDRRVISAIIFVIRSSPRWRDALAENGLHDTIHNHVGCGSRPDVFTASSLPAAKPRNSDRLMIAPRA